jgi:predicted tellurium resistance membrane protein TerC
MLTTIEQAANWFANLIATYPYTSMAALVIIVWVACFMPGGHGGD